MKSLALLLLASATAAAGCADDVSGPTPLTCDELIEVTAFRIDAVDLPSPPSAAEDFGADLDGDGAVDNRVGNVVSGAFSWLGAQAPWRNLDQQLTVRLDGDVDWQVERSTCPSSGESRLALADDEVPLAALMDFLGAGDPGWTRASSSLIEGAADDTGLHGEIAAALDPGYRDAFAAVFARVFTDHSLRRVELRDPDVDRLVDSMDTDGDREISEDELRAWSPFEDLMEPDLDVDRDRTPESMSIGLGFHATAVPTAP